MLINTKELGQWRDDSRPPSRPHYGLPAAARHRQRLCRAKNLSASGVFVETGNMGLRRGQTVELAFAISLGTVTKIHRRTAVVAHISRGGTGLMMEGQGG